MRPYPEVDAELTAAGGPYEIETIEIDGLPTRVWKHTPVSLLAILEEEIGRASCRERV